MITLEEALKTVEENGYVPLNPFALAARPYVNEVADFVEKAGYRVDSIEIERDKDCKASGRILLAIYPLHILERMEKDDRHFG
jgi:hypothetical protein